MLAQSDSGAVMAWLELGSRNDGCLATGNFRFGNFLEFVLFQIVLRPTASPWGISECIE